jgi:HPt (histidine-containing phosphotransfer) domain-containing protein
MKLDLNYLFNISDGDRIFVKEILEMFLTHSYIDIQKLPEIYAKGDMKEFHSAVHKLKSGVMMLGCKDASNAITELETAVKQNTDSADIVKRLSKFLKVADKLSSMVKEEVEKL